ncbi:MAG TPA: TonB-dependent receptor plug domain-containing protein [Cyclobacteriaceae bacterium]
MIKHYSCFKILFITVVLSGSSHAVLSQAPSYTTLKKLSIEDLMNVEVTSVSMRPEKLTEVPSAVQVISEEDIRRSAATRLPETLRLASNLQMAQASSNSWAITARGFNGLPSSGGILANKLLVMIDGRSIYNPLFGGVYWDVQNVLLEDINRVEVVSGPGGTLWGANAVNGVINIVTKSAKETQGIYASASGGSFLRNMAQLRYGFKIGENLFVRVYGQHLDQRNTTLSNEKSGHDGWYMTQGGFRMDYYPSQASTFTLQGDVYGGVINDSVRQANTDGQNVLARYTHKFSEKSTLTIQSYFDRTWRTTPHSARRFIYQLNTYDFDIQHRFSIGNRQSVLWGCGYRMQKDMTARSFIPPNRSMPLYSGFIQDEIDVVPGFLKLTIGSKFLHNVFTGYETQPTARLAFTPNDKNTIWTSVSRAVRIPTRFDHDITTTSIFGSEKVYAYELGYRVRPIDRLSLSLATFYNQYKHLRSLDSTSNPSQPIVLANSQKAQSWGIEFSGNFQATSWWRLRGGYTHFEKKIRAASSKVIPGSDAFEGVDPLYQFMFQSILDLPKDLQLDVVGRYIDTLPAVLTVIPHVPAYFTFDVRFAWRYKSLEFSVVGQNLYKDQHSEVSSSRIPRSVYGKITCRL